MISSSLLAACIWVVAATVVAMLPMRRQMVPGLALLIAAPAVIGFVGYQHGAIFAVLGLAGFVSMFRNPLRYLWKRARGERPDLPPELHRRERE